MEYCDRGDLEQFIGRMSTELIPESRIWKFFIQMCQGLSYLHGKNIVHGDIKPQNILLTAKDYELKLADFGISSTLGYNEGQVYEAVGSLAYCSPELLNE